MSPVGGHRILWWEQQKEDPLVSLYKVENGEWVFKDRGFGHKTEEYGRQGFVCIHEPHPYPHKPVQQNEKVAALAA